MTALLAVAHGSRDDRAVPVIDRLVGRVAALLPTVEVQLAWLDHREPTVPRALGALAADGHEYAAVVPLLLTAGYHSRFDLPRLLATAPLATGYTPVLGPHPLLAGALRERLAAAGVPDDAAVVLAAAGSSDPAAQADVRRMATLLAARRTGAVHSAYATAAAPRVADALRKAGRGAVVASYFLAPGALHDRVRAGAGDAVITEPLADTDLVARLVVERYAARSRAAVVPTMAAIAG